MDACAVKGSLPNGEKVCRRTVAEYCTEFDTYENFYKNGAIRKGGIDGWFSKWMHDGGREKLVSERVTPHVTLQDTPQAKTINILDDDLDLDEGISESVNPYIIPVDDKKILVISDVHLPYHDLTALKLAINYGKQQYVNVVLLNGDILDFLKVSKFTQNPSMPAMREELEMGKQFLQQLRKIFPTEKIIYKIGNHEHRLDDYIFRNAPALFGMDALRLESLLGLKELNIDFVSTHQIIQCGKIAIVHGHEMKAGGIHVARSIRMKANENILFGHHHRTQSDTAVNIYGDVQGSWAVGCLCDLRPAYMPYNQWNHGFAIVNLFKDGTFIVDNKKIINGRVY